MLLEPGLSMYLPTGTPHAARAQDTVSLHVTIGINQITWRTLLDRAVGEAMDWSRPTRTCRPATSTSPACWPRASTTRLSPLARSAGRAPTPPGSPTTRPGRSWRSATRTSAAPWSTGCVSTRSRGDTALRRRPGKPCVLRPDGDRLHLLLGDRRMTVPARITDAVERVRTLEVFTPDDLGLDTESGLVLCRRLLREGLLEVVR